MEQQEWLSVAIGMKNGTATLEDNLAVRTKLNIVLLCNSSAELLGIYPNEFKTWIYTKIYTDVDSNFIYNCQYLEATKMSCNRWMDNQTVFYPQNVLLFDDK